MAIVTKNNHLIPIIRINDKESGGAILNIRTEEYITKLKAGIDTTKFTGDVSFNHTTKETTISNGQIYIYDLPSAISFLGGYFAVRTWGGRNGNTGFINGHQIWKGKGTSYNVYDVSHLLRTGWNQIVMNVGGIIIRGPFLTEI